mmetsp:Transcript_63257/g.57005  ORF Transcript_63257/g.57005 Transcript_63257/m.57005 type:complete len:184 (+) Transcript_63257:1-552(+)
MLSAGGPPTVPVEIRGRRVYLHEIDYDRLFLTQFPGLDKVPPGRGNFRTDGRSLMFNADLALFYDLTNISSPGALQLECNAIDSNGNVEVLSFYDDTLPDGHEVQDCRVIPFQIDSNECDSSSSSSDEYNDDGNGPTSKYVRLYAMDNELWLEDFSKVFVKVSSISPLNTLTRVSEDSSSSSD